MATPKQIEATMDRKKSKLRRHTSVVETTKREIAQLQKSLVSAKKAQRK